jgi:hypothetical protein
MAALVHGPDHISVPRDDAPGRRAICIFFEAEGKLGPRNRDERSYSETLRIPEVISGPPSPFL